MKRLIGILIFVQAIFVAIICYQIKILSDSVLQAASFMELSGGTLAWGGNLPLLSILLLSALALLGIFLMFSPKNESL